MPHKHQSIPWLPISIIGQLVALLLIVLGVLGMSAPASPIRLTMDPLPTARPTPTQTPVVDWWSDLSMGQTALPALPAIPTVALDNPGSADNNAHTPDQPIPFETVSCPTSTVRIKQIVTGARPGWWIISGTATVDNFWYWKAELSADGSNWTVLHSGQSPIDSGRLLEFLTTTVPSGSYQLRLLAVDKSGNYPPPCTIRIQL